MPDLRENRYFHIDIIRTLAIALVVLNHSVEAVYRLNLEGLSNLSFSSKLFAHTAFTLGRLGVPLFLFITGSLILSRKYDKNASVVFWKRNLLPLFITTELWIVLYNIFNAWFYQRAFDWRLLMRNMAFLEGVHIPHMWYMPMILGMYVFLPYVSMLLQALEWKNIKFPLVLAVFYFYLSPVFNLLLTANGQPGVRNLLALDFGGGVYGTAIIGGYLSTKYKCGGGGIRAALLLLMVLSFVLTVWLQVYLYSKGKAYNVWYNCLPLLICSYCIFVLCLDIFSKKSPRGVIKRCVAGMAKISFGIYLAHMPVLRLVYRYFQWNVRMPCRVFLLWGSTFVMSGALVLLLSRNKKLGRFLFLVKQG